MKAIRVYEFGAPEVMRLEDVEDPQAGPGEVVVKIHAVGVNPVDTYIRSGLYTIKPDLPYTPGMDAAGVVESTGRGADRFRTGDRVYLAGTISGSYAEKVLCRESQVHPLPQQVSFAGGAAIGVPYATAYRALFQRAKATAGEVVLVHGATGGVGIASVQLARAAGMTVIATGGTEKGRHLAIEQGAHQVFDHRSPDHFSQILALTDNMGVNVIIEVLANVNLGNDLKVLAQDGRVVMVGSRGKAEIDPRDAMSRDASILGMVILKAGEKDLGSIHCALVAGLENGSLHPFVGKELPLSEAARAHHEIMETSALGKIILVP